MAVPAPHIQIQECVYNLVVKILAVDEHELRGTGPNALAPKSLPQIREHQETRGPIKVTYGSTNVVEVSHFLKDGTISPTA